MKETEPQNQRRLGLTRPGGVPALRVAVPLGLVASLTLGIARVVLVNPDGPYQWIAGVILGVCVAPCAIALAWVLVVDRTTLPGAVRNPEASVEGAWYSQAATISFHVVLVVCGLGSFLALFWLPSAVSWTFSCVFLVAALAWGVSYLWIARRSR
ncbi:hypothetical protein [Actinomyces provencensis]|uniref:hypothetical protein n=1 Tax=Actinomyces provencensis TaxID=1720198 RepID=UPI00096A2BCD|nr:hypothetical protein [Actinomyces provencensis]